MPLSLTMSNSSLAMLSARSSIEAIDPSEVPLWVSEQTLNQYFQMAILALLVYDALITTDKEAKYFWKVPQREVDFVYYMNRYIMIFGSAARLLWNSYSANVQLCKFTSKAMTIIFALIHASGSFSQWASDIASADMIDSPEQVTHCSLDWITITSIDYILIIRVLALYSQNRALSICLKLLLALEASFKIALINYLDVTEHIAIGGLAEGVTVCTLDTIPPWQWGMIDWMIPVGYGVVLMGLALYKASAYWKESAGFRGLTLAKVLFPHQIAERLVSVISCSVVAVLSFKLQIENQVLSNILSSLGNPALLSLLGTRMLFNLKEAGERGQNEGTSYRVQSGTVSEINFAAPVNAQRESEAEDVVREESA
ncbi:hypothetical protein A7U60_g5663 [Sanghuangporus baumii]|uniref:DUF6533 domain-containing protein n=1 Tax=Sanghuangporus baumii TaxID=108892 RepID=A0A9Q5HWI1_SANBA|nr:hypothetical protein A7U60_g5663 [Sanghuangporus baumii]